ncbi:MAG: tetratricopeptide repeat protein [Acidobacteriia bacterium]|nr:tetratricopeptide repeat protein [Terriglobia bacterium]
MVRITVLVFLLTLFAAAQRRGPGGAGTSPSGLPNTQQQISSLQVHVVRENERSVDDVMRVQLLRTDGATPVAETFSRDGIAEFRSIAPGSYILRVSGSNIEEATTMSFNVPPFAAAVQFVHVQMRSLAGTNSKQSRGSRQGPVSAQDLNVPNKAREELRKAGQAMQEEDWKKATGHLNKAVSIYPQYAAAYNNLGFIAMKLKDWPKAQTMFQKAADLNDSTGYAYVNLGRVYLIERNFEEAARLMNKTLALDPNNVEALTILSDCDVATGKYDEAIANVRRVHSAPHEHYAVVHLIAAVALEKQNHPQRASAEYELFLQEDPESPRAAAARRALDRLAANNRFGVAAPHP